MEINFMAKASTATQWENPINIDLRNITLSGDPNGSINSLSGNNSGNSLFAGLTFPSGCFSATGDIVMGK